MRSGVYVRAKDPVGRWGSVLAEDLDEQSFRMFVLMVLSKAGLVTHLVDQHNEPKELRTPHPHGKEDTYEE